MVFTAHSIPLSMAATSEYQTQLREAAAIVSQLAGTGPDWDLVFQSRSGPPQVPWLEPDIVDHLDALHQRSTDDVVVVPLGFDSFAAFKLDDQMAKTPDRVRDLLMVVWTPARARALQERDAMQALAAAEGANIKVEPWDWRHYAEKQRKAEHELDEAEIKPYLELDAMIEAAHFIQTLEKRQGLKVACPEETAFKRGWIDRDQVLKLAGPLRSSGYGDYLVAMLDMD